MALSLIFGYKRFSGRLISNNHAFNYIYNFLPILYWPITVEIRQNVLVVRNTNMRLLRSYSLFNSDLLTI